MVKVFQGTGAAHLQIQPKLAAPGILYAKMVQGLALGLLSFSLLDSSLALRAGGQMLSGSPFGNLYSAISALSF